MMRALWSAASGMLAQQLNVDTISNNLSNVNTPGFKRSRVEFQDLLYENIRPAGATTALGARVPLGLDVGHGVRPVATQRIFSAGNLQRTENRLDLAIQGEGFFQVDMGDNRVAYTRDGSFHLDSDGYLVTSSGYRLLQAGGGGPIQLPQNVTDISISSTGTVAVREAGQNDLTDVGQIGVYTFPNAAGLQAEGGNLFLESPASGLAGEGTPGQDGAGTIVQGFLEMSNVSVVEEMVNLIIAQRAYEVNTKAVQSSDEMLQQANNLRR